jgi:hypothetical protein
MDGPAPVDAEAELLHDEKVAEAGGADQVQLVATQHFTGPPHHAAQADLNLDEDKPIQDFCRYSVTSSLQQYSTVNSGLRLVYVPVSTYSMTGTIYDISSVFF